MSEQTLLTLDVRIAKLRDDIAAGRASFEMVSELDRLIEERIAHVNAKGPPRPLSASQKIARP